MGKISLFVQRAACESSGNVAILFALCAMGMIGIVGIGIDTSRAIATKSTLDASADAAALAAVTEAQAALNSSNLFYSNAAMAMGIGQTAGVSVFNTNAAKVGSTIGGAPTPTVTVLESSVNGKNVITATVSYQATSPNVFGPIYGSKNVALSGTAKSALTLPSYMNITVAIDISQSMGLAATSAAQTTLANLTGGCAFGCHAYQGGQKGSAPYETQAHNASIDLRIDVIKGATQSMIMTAKNLTSGTPLISFALYTFGTSLTSVAASSSNYDLLNSTVSSIDLDGSTDTNGYGDTGATLAPLGTTTPMQSLTSQVPTSGTGNSASSPQQYVFIMTDGVEDILTSDAGTCRKQQGANANYAFQWGHCTAPFDPSQCAAFKAKGVTVGVIYTTYLQMPSRVEWTNLVQPFTGSIASNMQACATPGWYYQATEASDIQAAVNALFAQATGHGILTQ